MKKLVAIALLSLSLAACASGPKVVDLPVAVPCPKPPQVARPHLPIAELKQTSSPAEVLKAYSVSVELLKGYAAQLEEILKGYR